MTMQQPPNHDDDELYDERELAEIDELNSMTGESRSLLDSPWWKRIAIGFAAVLLLALLLPTVVLPVLDGLRDRGAAPEPPPSTLAVPDFELQAAQGGTVRLSDAAAGNEAVVLVFYRGYF